MNSDAVVPNQAPSVDAGSVRLSIVGEAPAVEECSWRHCIPQGHGYAGEHWEHRQLVTRDRCPLCGSQQWTEAPTPFVGESGRLLDSLLRDAGLPRERCFVGNCSRHPLAEHEKRLDCCKGGLSRLALDLEAFRPHVVLCLGNLSLSAFMGEGHAVTNWRGSLFEGRLAGVTYKCVAAMHPAAILREPGQLCLLRDDVKKAVAEAGSPALDLPKRVVSAPPYAEGLYAWLWDLRKARKPLGYDIEGTVQTGITVCSFADSPLHAISIPFRRLDWSRVWNEADEVLLLAAIGELLADPNVPKVAHNAMYEGFGHRWLHGHVLRNVEDTMLAWHVLFPELLKDLSVVSSVLVPKHQYWGSADDWGVYDRPATDADRDLYNATDSMVTLECWQAIQREMTPAQRAYYEHQRALLEPCLEMSFEGMPYDAAKRDAMVAALEREVHGLQGELDSLAGIPLPSFGDIRDAVCMKVKAKHVVDWSDVLAHSKPSFKA